MLSGSALSPIPTLTITEQNETLTADYNGTPITLALGGPVDGWTADLPSQFALFPNIGLVLLGEPEDADRGNEIIVGSQPTTILWTSDLLRIGAGEPTIKNIGPAGIFTAGPGIAPETFQLILQDLPETAPDAGATIVLLGGATLLLGTLRTRR